MLLPSFPVAFLHQKQIACFCHLNQEKERNVLIMLFSLPSACNWLCEPRALSPPQLSSVLTPQVGDLPWYISPSLLPL